MKTLITATSIAAMFPFVIADAAASGPAPRYVRQATVYIGDLDLDREPDARALYERISYAAQAICSMDDSSPDARHRRQWRECAEAAVTKAVDEANAPLLEGVHRARREHVAHD